MGSTHRWPLNRQLPLHSLLLITSLAPTVFGSSADQPARSPAPTPRPCLVNTTVYISYCVPPSSPSPSSRGGGSSPAGYPIAAPVKTWWVNRDAPDPGGGGGVRFSYDDGSIVRALLLRPGRSGPAFACGFFCLRPCNATLFSIFLVVTSSSSAISSTSSGFPQVVWSANRNNPVGEGALLQLTSDGLVLLDSGGTMVWSTDTVGKNVSTVNLTGTGNLVLYSSSGETVWQSFDHATDTVLQGQSVAGQRLVANASTTNTTEGRFYLNVTHDSFYASIDSEDTRGMYYSEPQSNGGVLFPPPKHDGEEALDRRPLNGISSAYQFMRLDCDGHLRKYWWYEDEQIWKAVGDRLIRGSGHITDCSYPTVCGDYGICSDGQCSCPGDNFQSVDARKPNHGCSPVAPMSCQSPVALILLPNVSFFGYVQEANLVGTDVESCRGACLADCTCKAAFFRFHADPSKGDCYLPSRVLSLMENKYEITGFNSSAFIKVQNASQHAAGKRSRVVLGSTLGAFFVLILLGVVAGVIVLRRRWRRDDEEAEECLPHLPGMPARFSYNELKAATGNFSTLLGEGGFGSVFLGTLADGMSVAVKLLGGKSQGKKEFLAEVETIGSIHHVNLVRLVGYCAHKLHRLLVYEYMYNGSLDKWIFRRDDHPRTLDWQTRHKIMLHVAKGLAYLHEDCRHRIAHLDIKPENILLDEGFNAKVSDFGLSRLIDRDQSQVLTTLRGTPGYLAPEWLSSMISEKVDIYSFGVVVLETVCGRRNIDGSRPKQNYVTLVNEAKSAAENDRLLDIVDRNCEGIEYCLDEAIEMVRTALWCLQGDPDRRPLMSTVVKVLEGVMVVEPVLDSNFAAPSQVMDNAEVCFSSSTPMLASTLSGPR